MLLHLTCSFKMISEGFCDAMFDPSFDSTSTDFPFCDSWPGDNLEGFPTMADQQLYQLNTWKSKPITSWTSNEILHWMCNEASINNRNYEEVKLRNFVEVSSDNFRDMSLNDFVRRSESYEDGELFYKSKENLVRHHQLDYNTNRTEIPQTEALQDCPGQRPHRLSYSSSESSASEQPTGKRRGRPKSSHTIRKKPEKRMGKLWEFLRNLLLDDKTCPSLIKWDNHLQGTFKFVQSEKVAKLWGDRKKNDKMNYEKLSRAMRYYYRSRVLLPVAGKRLVYQFGEAATGWQTKTPILDEQ